MLQVNNSFEYYSEIGQLSYHYTNISYEWLLQCNATQKNFNSAKLNFRLKTVKI